MGCILEIISAIGEVPSFILLVTRLTSYLLPPPREHNMVRFQNGKPTGIYYSQHSDGAAYAWDDAALSMKDERVCRL